MANTYDELGQLIGKGVGGRTTRGRLQNVDYGYNIRGWLKTINNLEAIGNDLFTFRLHYNDPANTTPALYNGNISQTYWKTANSDNSLKHYNYRYDALNRLTFATDNQDRYSENLNYDKNGNITDLVRKGAINSNATAFGVMDQLTYHYDTGNKLLKVQDALGSEGFRDGTNAGDDYTYDSNGNMTSDANKGITSITYNHLNLPVEITTTTGVSYYGYDATGVKLLKVVLDPDQQRASSVIQYAGAYQYEVVSGVYTLKFFSQPEGYVAYNDGIFSYIYQYKDHLGNNRLSYSDSNDDGQVTASEIIEEDNYYPFGMKQKGYNSVINGVAHKYKYNGKELQDEMGLNLYDYGARNYDPALGRWMNIDPLAEKMRRHSPYNYAFNNPIYFIDPDGMAPADWIGIKVGKDTYRPEWRDNVTGANDKDIGAGNIYIGKTGTISAEGVNYDLNADKTASISKKKDKGNSAVGTTEIDMEKVGQTAAAIGAGAAAKEVTISLAIETQATQATLDSADEVQLTTSRKLLRATELIGKATGIVGALSAISKAIDNPTTGNLVNAVFNTGMVFVRTNPAVGLIMGVLDATGVSDKVYEGMGRKINESIGHPNDAPLLQF